MDYIDDIGFAGSPNRGELQDKGEYLLPKEVVEYHGLKHLRQLEDEAYWAMQDDEDETPDEEEEEDLEDEVEEEEDDLPKKTKQKSFGISKKTKTAFMK